MREDRARMLLVVDVGNTQTHFGTYEGEDLLEHWRFATVRSSTADELGAALRALLELRGIGLADLDGSIISSTVPQLEPEWIQMGRRYLGHDTLAVGPGLRTAMPIASTTRASSARTAWSTRSPPSTRSAARSSPSTSAPR
jgi:type III pantothenate kinase